MKVVNQALNDMKLDQRTFTHIEVETITEQTTERAIQLCLCRFREAGLSVIRIANTYQQYIPHIYWGKFCMYLDLLKLENYTL